MESPKVFISYSWTSPEHEQLVLDLATQLRDVGIDAILDKWDLREGEDADKFMERMVADPEVKKVLIICDRKYAEKSNKRQGGVGTEAQIISRKVYEQQDEHKFVVASFELDENTGKPIVPIYYSSRKYIDFTDGNRYAEKFEELVRWVFDKPLYEKPVLGKIPDYLISEERQTLRTSAAYHRVMFLLKEGRSNAKGALQEYLKTFATNLESFRITESNKQKYYHDLFFESIESFLPYRNEWTAVFDAVCQYADVRKMLPLYYTFFEKIHAYIKTPEGISSYSHREEENMKFFEEELFLYFLAILLKCELLDEAEEVLSHQFFDSTGNYEFGAAMDYAGFQHPIYSFDDKYQVEQNKYISYQSHIMHNRAKNCQVLEVDDVMQADLVAYLRIALSENNDYRHHWYPRTLLYVTYKRIPFMIFSRATSSQYFARVAKLLHISGKAELLSKYQELKEKNNLPAWMMNYPSYNILMNLEHLATQ